MKDLIKSFFPWTLSILCAICSILILFYGLLDGSYISFDSAFSNITQKQTTTTIAEQIYNQNNVPIPTILYIGKTLYIREANPLLDLFAIQSDLGELSTINMLPDTALYLVDIKSSRGFSTLTKLSTNEIEQLEDIPSKTIYDKDKNLLYFYQSDVYTLYLQFYYNHQPGILLECRVPVEMR